MKSIYMNFYSDGFFGYGVKGDFKPYSFAHIFPIIIIILLIIAIYKNKEFFKQWKHEEMFRVCFVSAMILVEMSFFWRLFYVGSGNNNYNSMMNYLPLQVCQWTLLITCFMMLTKSRKVFGLTFYLVLTSSLLGILFAQTVISDTGLGYYRYYQFWLEHGLPIIGNFYMLFAYDFDLKLKEIWKPYAFLIPLSIPCVYFDLKFKECNYMYFKLDFSTFTVNQNATLQSILFRYVLYFFIMLACFLIAIGIYKLVRKGSTKSL